jgi:hypothetical protein
MDSFFRKFKKPVHTKPWDYARSDLWQSCMALGSGVAILTLGLPVAAVVSPVVAGLVIHGAALLGPWGVFAAMHLAPVLKPMALAASVMGAATSTLRAGLYFDFYARRRNEDGQGNAFTRVFTRLWAKTPLILLTRMKIEQDRRDETLRRHFGVLDRRVNEAADDGKREAYRRDNKAYARILKTIYPNNDLLPSAAGALTAIGSANSALATIAEGLSWLALPVKIVMAGAGAVYSLVHLSMFTAKKSAGAVNTPWFDKIDAAIRKTSLQRLVRMVLGRQMRRIDALDITPELTRDLVSLSIDETLQSLAKHSNFPCRGMLKTLFDTAAARDIPKAEAQPACVTAGNSTLPPCKTGRQLQPTG